MSDNTPQTPDDAVVDLDAGEATGVALEPVMQPLSDDNDDDLTTLLAKRQHARPNRATWTLLVLIVLALGFVGGAFAQKTWGPSSSTTGLPDFAALGGGFPGVGGAAGGTTSGGTSTGTAPGTGAGAAGGQAGGFGGFGGGMTFGTLTAVDGDTLTVTGQDGTTTTVKVPDSATVTASTAVPLSGLKVGETVVVRGEAGDDGTVTASSVSQGAGGFPAFGGGGPGAPAPGAPAPSAQPSTAPTQGDAS